MATIYAFNKQGKKTYPTFYVNNNEEYFLQSVVRFVASLMEVDASPTCDMQRDKTWTTKVHAKLSEIYAEQLAAFDPKKVEEVFSDAEITKYIQDGKLVATTKNIEDVYSLVSDLAGDLEDLTYNKTGKLLTAPSNDGYGDDSMEVRRFVEFLKFIETSGGISVNRTPRITKKKKKVAKKKKAAAKKKASTKKATKKKKVTSKKKKKSTKKKKS